MSRTSGQSPPVAAICRKPLEGNVRASQSHLIVPTLLTAGGPNRRIGAKVPTPPTMFSGQLWSALDEVRQRSQASLAAPDRLVPRIPWKAIPVKTAGRSVSIASYAREFMQRGGAPPRLSREVSGVGAVGNGQILD